MPNAEKPSPVHRRGPGRAWNGLDRLTGLGRRLLGRGRFWLRRLLRRLLRRGLHDSPPLSSSQALYPGGDERKHPGDQRAVRRDQRGLMLTAGRSRTRPARPLDVSLAGVLNRRLNLGEIVACRAEPVVRILKIVSLGDAVFVLVSGRPATVVPILGSSMPPTLSMDVQFCLWKLASKEFESKGKDGFFHLRVFVDVCGAGSGDFYVGAGLRDSWGNPVGSLRGLRGCFGGRTRSGFRPGARSQSRNERCADQALHKRGSCGIRHASLRLFPASVLRQSRLWDRREDYGHQASTRRRARSRRRPATVSPATTRPARNAGSNGGS